MRLGWPTTATTAWSCLSRLSEFSGTSGGGEISGITVRPGDIVYASLDYESGYLIEAWQRSGGTWSLVDSFAVFGSVAYEFRKPKGLAATADGRVWVCDDTNDRIAVWQEVSSVRACVARFGEGVLQSQTAIMIDAGTIYIADDERVSRWTESGGVFTRNAEYSKPVVGCGGDAIDPSGTSMMGGQLFLSNLTTVSYGLQRSKGLGGKPSPNVSHALPSARPPSAATRESPGWLPQRRASPDRAGRGCSGHGGDCHDTFLMVEQLRFGRRRSLTRVYGKRSPTPRLARTIPRLGMASCAVVRSKLRTTRTLSRSEPARSAMTQTHGGPVTPIPPIRTAAEASSEQPTWCCPGSRAPARTVGAAAEAMRTWQDERKPLPPNASWMMSEPVHPNVRNERQEATSCTTLNRIRPSSRYTTPLASADASC